MCASRQRCNHRHLAPLPPLPRPVNRCLALLLFVSAAGVLQLSSAANNGLSVVIHNDASCSISVSWGDTGSIILDNLQPKHQNTINSFSGHNFRATCSSKERPEVLDLPAGVQWTNPSHGPQLHVHIGSGSSGLTASIECRDAAGEKGKCMEPNALPRSDAPKLSQKSSTPRMIFENAAAVPVNVYWMTVNKRHLQAALSLVGNSRKSSTVSHTGHTFRADRADGKSMGCNMRAGYFDQHWVITYDTAADALVCTPDVLSPVQLTIRNQASIQVSINGTLLEHGLTQTLQALEGQSVVVSAPGGASVSHTMGAHDSIVAILPPQSNAAALFQLEAHPRDYDTDQIDISDEPSVCRKEEPEPLSTYSWELQGKSRAVEHFADFGDEVGVFRIRNFISDAECGVLTNTTVGWAGRAKTASGGLDPGRLAYSSNVYYEPHNPDGKISSVISRVFDFARSRGLQVALEGQEPLNMIEYVRKEHYKPHCDSVCGGGDYAAPARVATMILYCKVAESGGGTAFPNADLVLHSTPGDALFFRYKTKDNKMDPQRKTLHTGCPVQAGEKKIVTQWIREGVSAEHTYDGRAW